VDWRVHDGTKFVDVSTPLKPAVQSQSMSVYDLDPSLRGRDWMLLQLLRTDDPDDVRVKVSHCIIRPPLSAEIKTILNLRTIISYIMHYYLTDGIICSQGL